MPSKTFPHKIFALIGILCIIVQSQAGDIVQSLRSKVFAQGSHDAILQLPSVMGSVLSNPILNGLSGPEKTNVLIDLLKQSTTALQAPFLQSLSLFGADVTPFWISNKIAIKNASPFLLSMLTMIPGTFTLREPQQVKLTVPIQVRESNATIKAGEVQWGVNKIGAPSVWPKTKGEGIIVANIDTGVHKDHEALKSNYAGAGGWYDAINEEAGPYDDQGHGTHTMGSICGTTKGIGVAPGAKWIACKALDDRGSGTEQQLSACAQWILKPNGDTKLKPHVVSNSWGGNQNKAWFDDEIKAWKAANIIPIFSIGNSGSKCKSANTPGDRPGVISVGSTKSDDTMSSFSSRGKSLSGTMKPEISAPGDRIYSAGHMSSNSYKTMSGTSMACPHVAGAVALLMSGKVATTFDQVFDKFKVTSYQPSGVTKADLKCGTTNGKKYPNNAYGYGRIDIKKAFGM